MPLAWTYRVEYRRMAIPMASGGTAHLPGPPHCLLRPVTRVTAMAVILAWILAAQDLSAQPRFEGEGRVVALDATKGTVTLDHGPIPGFMAAMRMEFPVLPSDLLRRLAVGDIVRFSLETRGPQAVVVGVEIIGAPTSSGPATLPAPDFTLPTLSAMALRLSALRGKVVVLNFWATWCLPCRAEMPALDALYQLYRDRGLDVIGVNLDRLSTTTVEDFLKEVKVSFHVVLDPSWSTAQAYKVVGLPTTYLIDRAGSVVVREVGERDWTDETSRRAVERLLQEGGSR
jgi:thiol-disulfide isomerase/thioredoxin